MIEVTRLNCSKEQLQAMPVGDRNLILLAGHALNGLGAWVKMLRFSANNDHSDITPEAIGTTFQTSLINRSLYGHIVETANWLDRGETKNLIEAYLNDMPVQSREAYLQIRERLDARPEGGPRGSISPILSSLRNKFAYHFPKPNALQDAFDYSEDDPDTWAIYASGDHTNSCYWVSEIVVGFGSLSLTGIKTAGEAFNLVINESIRSANILTAFLTGLLSSVYNKHLGGTAREVFLLPNAVKGRDFKLPFYAEDV